MEKRWLVFIAFLFTNLLMAFASAEIMLSQPKELYNLGNTVEITATVRESVAKDGFFSLLLLCNGKEQEFYRQYLALNAGGEKTVRASIILRKDVIGIDSAVCRIKAKFTEELAQSSEFKLSNKLLADITLEKISFKPQESIIIKGAVKRENKESVNGFVELSVSATDIKIIGDIIDGSYFLNFSFPQNAKAQQYLLHINVYERDNTDAVSNTGFVESTISIQQVPTAVDIVLDTQEGIPGSKFSFKPVLYDQAGDEMIGDGLFTVKDPANKIMEQLKGGMGEQQQFTLSSTAAPGYWKIFGVSSTVSQERMFLVVENEEAEFIFKNTSILVKNTGNVPYEETVLVKIGDITENINVNLKIGETKEYKLSAPPGNYTIVLSDGKKEVQGSAEFTAPTITGSAISISEKNGFFFSFSRMAKLLGLIIIALILGYLALLITRKKERFAFMRHKYEETNLLPVRSQVYSKNSLDNAAGGKKSFVDLANKINPESNVKYAEQAVEIKGSEQDVAITCLKIRNYDEIARDTAMTTKETMNHISQQARGRKAVSYKTREYIMFFFAPTITGVEKNEKSATELAAEISSILKKHNQTFKQKIQPGLSIATGKIISKIEGEKLLFTTKTNVLGQAKKLADSSTNDVLMSDFSRQRMATANLKVEKMQTGNGGSAYKLRDFRPQSEDREKFMRDFLRRNKDMPEFSNRSYSRLESKNNAEVKGSVNTKSGIDIDTY